MGAAGRRLFALLNVTVTLGAAWALYQLWTEQTPGWWFNLIFTVMIGGLTLALWAILRGSIRQAEHEARLQAVWRDIGPRAVATAGRVTERHCVMAEGGEVMRFELVVQAPGGAPIHGQWQPANARLYLLQPQVPGVGAEVRIWRAPNTPANAPLVIEVADPSVVH
ncbi:hypothetical protein DX914_02570 [Lysobacter silvisoli]|uniref:DUF3592 domain-containing protein n=2 Tax=Lysobacter silvisoli TaxID=2293254 RepID=A0A371K294_9GAMM|nr:hypothetical protein DX914_02570 [Lysobacter silvisoli]